jgi:hypothetical protein
MTELNDDYVSIEIRKRIAYITDAMRHGHPKDWTDYQYLRGQIEGMDYSLGIISELKKKMEEEENE